MNRMLYVLGAALIVTGCGGAKTPAENVAAAAADDGGLPPSNALPPPEMEVVPPSETSLPTDAWIGKWVGVEGLALDIEPGSAAGKYALSVTLLDGTSQYEGTGQDDAIMFTRAGKAETIRAVSGAETGLKYLADKQDCLMIKQGEGFCRD